MPPAAKAAKNSDSSRPRHWNEVIGLSLVVIGVAYFMALVSYTPRDVPTWVWFSTASPPNSPAQNFVGPVGAVIAGFSYLCLGAASYLVAALLLGYGGVKLVLGSSLLRRLPWVIVFIISGACLAQIQPWFLQSWAHEFNNDGPGGTIGYHLGKLLLERLLGGPGSTMLVAGVYFISLVLATGIRPIHLLIASISWIKRTIIRAFEAVEQRRLENATEGERQETELRRLEKEQRRLERDLRKKGVPTDGLTPQVPASDLLPSRPPPKVTDTSVPLPAAKPKLDPKKKEQEMLHPVDAGAFEDYKMPDLDLLDERDFSAHSEANHDELLQIQATLIETLAHFGIAASPGDITKGPTITRYEVYPAKGVRVDRIASLEADIQRATRAERINILAPIPGKDTVGIEIANSKKVKVTLREILESEDWANTKARIPIALGKDVYGKTIIADLAAMPHCLVAGTTGSGKSVCINAVIASILYKFTPDQLRFIMIDPKVVEMQIYNTLPHLVVPVVTDPKKVLLALRWVINEMENRYQMFAKLGVRNIASFNARPLPKTQAELDAEADRSHESDKTHHTDEPLPDDFISDEVLENAAIAQPELPKISVQRDDDLIIPDRLPYIVVIVDELADLMQTAPADVESGIARITQKARAAGIHMIIATQTPRADVITGVIKANVPCRIAFQVASGLDSRIILDEKGAERLLGQGDMLYMPPGANRIIRSQGVLVTDDEIQKLVDYVSAQAPATFDEAVQKSINTGGDEEEEVSEEDEELVQKCLEIIRQEKKASTSLLQRRLRLGYTRAARIVDILENRGILGPGEGAKPREILVDLDSLV